MKKTILVLTLLGLASGLYAGPVTPEKALKVAEKVFNTQYSTKAQVGEPKIIWDGEFEHTKSAEEPAFYVVARDGGGFVIVAGNDNVQPVLGISMESHFEVEGMPANVRYWMEKIKAYVRGTSQATPEIKAQWESYADTKSNVFPDAGVTMLSQNKLTVPWNQNGPANLLMPTVPGETERAVCGCVATAIAEIMTWHGYPKHGEGIVDAYISNEGESNECAISSHKLGTVYLWSELQKLTTREAFYAESDTDLGQNLAQLVYDIGTIMQLNYSVNGTSGNLNLLVSKFCEHMSYSKNAVERSLQDEGYPLWKWNQMLQEEIDMHPTYYSATDRTSGGGHAYVLDAYGSSGGNLVFHFNFGWGGRCNGYYYSDYQYTEEDDDFGDVTALFGFSPDPSHTSTYLYELSYFDIYGNYPLGYDQRGVTLTHESGNTVRVLGNVIINSGTDTFSGKIALCLLNKDDEGSVLGESNKSLAVGYYTNYYGFTIPIPEGTSLGDRFTFLYKSGGGDYKQIASASPSAILIEQPVFPAAFIKTEASYNKNDYFYFRLTNHDVTYPDAVWDITDPNGNKLTLNQGDDRVKLSKSGKYKIKVTPVAGGESIVAVINVK